MAIYAVRMDHPDGEGWGRHVVPHLLYLKELIDRDKLLASGPLVGTELRTGFLLFEAESRAEVEALVAADPFAIEGLIVALRIEQWAPLFGMLAVKSSGGAPPAVQAIFDASSPMI